MQPAIRDIPCFIFDFDGTIFDSDEALIKHDTMFLSNYGTFTFDRRQHRDQICGFTALDYMHFLKRELQLEPPVEALYEEFTRAALAIYNDCTVIHGALNLLTTLKELGKRVGIATANSADAVNQFLSSNTQFSNLVDVVVSCEEVEVCKPNPEVYIRCAQKLGYDISCCVILEDSLVGLRGARASGAKVYGVLAEPDYQRQQLCDWWGYDLTQVLD
ncbi:Beta-phosphoglucomutase [Spironucleus salmonicida]|uniref:Beta-phosphoglucomutase n=1 Tax=Spironucleus salmonicida TaxID=348837 RepID=A0A9P8LP45_9EUKA|nr:Beta-phosphoglucomutase [Spironucleus salmonicida]